MTPSDFLIDENSANTLPVLSLFDGGVVMAAAITVMTSLVAVLTGG